MLNVKRLIPPREIRLSTTASVQMASISMFAILLGTLIARAVALPATTTLSQPRTPRYTAQVSGVKNDYGSTNWVASVTIGGYEGNLLIDTGSSDL